MADSEVTQAVRKGATIVNVGTRKTPLALEQARLAVTALEAARPDLKFVIHGMTTTGDRDHNTALYNFGGKGLWTSQFEELLAKGDLDIVVHSLKDMPTVLPEGCVLGGITHRADARDTLVVKKSLVHEHGWTKLSDLPDSSIIGTSSIRRIAQLRRKYPGLKFKDVRGSIHTRLNKLENDPELTAIVLAAAGLQRMDMDHYISQFLDSESGGIMYAVGQGGLGIECRAGDERVLQLLKGLGDENTTLACLAERSLMRTLEGGCSVPIGVESHWVDGKLRIRAIVVNAKGTESVEAEKTDSVTTVERAEELGQQLALELVKLGADKILDEINAARPMASTTTAAPVTAA